MDDEAKTKKEVVDVFDVVVIGAGIEGSAAAYYSVRDGRRVLLLEQFSLPHTRGSSHGGNRVSCFAQSDEPYQRLIEEAYPLWEELEKETNTEILRKVGMLLISPDGWEDGYPHHILQSMMKSGSGLDRIPTDEANTRFPNFISCTETELYLFKNAGYIRANKALQAFQGEFVKHGGVLHDEEKMLEIVPGSMVTVKTNRSEYQTRSVILAPGSWASPLLKQLGLNIPLEVFCAYHIFWKEKVPGMYGDFPVFNDISSEGLQSSGSPSHEYPGLMKISRWNPSPIDDPDFRDRSDQPRELDLNKKYVREHFPGLDADNGPAIKEACLVTNTPDAGFILDVHPYYSNIVIACGFSGRGFEFAPIVGRIMTQLSKGTKPQLDITAFRMNRFYRQ